MTHSETPQNLTETEAGSAPRLIRVAGKVTQILFTTENDLRPFVSEAFELADSHRAFAKVFELKFGPVDRPFLPPAFSQYRQVSLAVMGGPRGLEPRHINLLMWEQRGWSLGYGGDLWHKKLADIEMTALYPVEERYRDPAVPTPFMVDVSTYGSPLMHFEGALDGVARIAPPPANGFYFGGRNGADIYCLPLREAYLGEPWHGGGTLKFWRSPDEYPTPTPGDWRASAFGDVEVEGFCVQDITFMRDYGDLITIKPSDV
jgi:hypothetical protein